MNRPHPHQGFTFVETTEVRQIAKIMANDAKASSGSTIDVKDGGALRSSDATIAVAHNIEVKMLTALMEFILALSRIAICRVE